MRNTTTKMSSRKVALWEGGGVENCFLIKLKICDGCVKCDAKIIDDNNLIGA